MTQHDRQPRAAIGKSRPAQVGELPSVDWSVAAGWRNIPGLSSNVSDILDELGYRLSVPATCIPSRLPGSRVVGRAVTLQYLPERRSHELAGDGLIHKSAMELTSSGDVLVIAGDGIGQYSVFGGLAAHRAVECGIAGIIVDGAVRDVDQLADLRFPVWSRGVTPTTGRARLQGVGINVPIRLHDVQVLPGDIVVADDSGICFVPADVLREVDRRLRELIEEEAHILGSK
ncbi:RraA family protein [Alicyclobacillus shizuokensis]|uniref:RraA family protein n=1 Tax=Alicyclobacillus shizuokensis TaxID=392014 RepID=UPI000835ABB1|nr:RraA family protein [Alicyclobacillus shizuokensis]MCL6627414.1 RraA family protein [Alicyclobacillus shizuokensis]